MNIRKAWEDRSEKYGKNIEGVLPKSFPRPVNRYLDRWMYENVKGQIFCLCQDLGGQAQLKILDLGCGYGRLSKKILKDFPNTKLFGVDIAQTYVDLYNKDLSPRGKAKRADLKRLPFPNSHFNLVFMVTTLMYLINEKDHQKAMKEIFRVLKPGGRFVIIERNPIGHELVTLGGLLEIIRGRKLKEIDSISFSQKYMCGLIEKNGGTTISVKGIPFWTITLPISFIINKPPSFIDYFDDKFGFLLTPSLYISYSGFKK